MVVVAIEGEGALRQAQTIPAGCTSGPIREVIRSVVHPAPITDPNIYVLSAQCVCDDALTVRYACSTPSHVAARVISRSLSSRSELGAGMRRLARMTRVGGRQSSHSRA